jgi:hypothetical protein
MKKIFIPFILAGSFVGLANAQTYSENFDSMTAGAYIAQTSPNWSTWSNNPGGTEDAQVTSAKSSSGPNSLEFYSTSTNGGPMDLLLDFGGEYNTGDFEISFNMFVETNKGAHLNLQGESTAGQTWHSSFQFNHQGQLTAYGDGFVLEKTYPMNQWFNFKLKGDLNTSKWELYIDNNLEGTFIDENFQIASLNIYPANSSNSGGNGQSKFWLDDISFEHTPYTMPAKNGGLISVSANQGVVGQTRKPRVIFRNLGTDAISSTKIEIDYNGNSYNETFPLSPALASGEAKTLDFTNGITLVAGEKDLTATLDNGANDVVADDNSAVTTINPIVAADGKMVVVEEATGTWCSWCPRGAVYMELAEELYADYVQGIAVHNNDPMADETYDTGLSTITSGYPSAAVNREEDIDPSAIINPIAEHLAVAPSVLLTNGAIHDEAAEKLKVSVRANITEDINGNWKIACAIVENNVTGNTSGYSQANAYAGGGNGEMGGYENLPSTVHYSQMTYQEVARAISPSFEGYEGFTVSNGAGDVKIFNFEFDIDPDLIDLDEVHIVGMVMSADGKINNGASTTYTEAETNGWESGEFIGLVDIVHGESFVKVDAPLGSENIFIAIENANTASDFTLEIVDMLGKVVYTSTMVDNSSVEIAKSNFSAGTYVVKLNDKKNVYSQKIIVD